MKAKFVIMSFGVVLAVTPANAQEFQIRLSCDASAKGAPRFDLSFQAHVTETQPIYLRSSGVVLTGNIYYDYDRTIKYIMLEGQAEELEQILVLRPSSDYTYAKAHMSGWLMLNDHVTATRHCDAFYSKAYLYTENPESPPQSQSPSSQAQPSPPLATNRARARNSNASSRLSSNHGTGSEWGVVVTMASVYDSVCGGLDVSGTVRNRYRNDVAATGVTVNDEAAAKAFFVIQKNMQDKGVAATCAELGQILRNLGYIR